jgi:hypothetical protein
MRRCHALALCALAGTLLHAGGFGLGVQMPVAMDRGGVLVPRMDFLHATDSSSSGSLIGPVALSATANILSVGADYNYFTGDKPGLGLFVLGGLGIARASLDLSASAPGAAASTTSQQWRIYPEVGVGYQFTRHLGVELLYRNLSLSDVHLTVGGVPAVYSFTGSVEAAFVVRF